ncbi:hypothetical protein [Agromyces sp. NPDC056965]|uniref:hypothetical protein n=1 Tax=Agromyces sp. NPDC056965 TaxID=3345983 RepID=UPI00363E92C8
MISQKGMKRGAGALMAGILGVVLALSGSAAANADVPITITVVVPDTPFSYGEYWNLEVKASGLVFGTEPTFSGEVRVSSIEGAYGAVTFYPGTEPGTATAYIGASPSLAPLDAGEYDVQVSVATTTPWGIVYTGRSEPVTFTVAPAPLSTSVRMTPDPSNADNSIVALGLSGAFVSQLAPGVSQTENPSVPVLPAGAWRIAIVDDSGASAFDTTIDQPDGGQPAVSVYWVGAEPSTSYSVTGSFKPNGQAAGNFTISDAPAFPYTSPSPQRPQPTPAVAGPVAAAPTEDGNPTLPVWSVVALVLVALGLMVAIVVLLISERRDRSRTTEGGRAHAIVA